MIFQKKEVSGPQLEILYNAIPFSDEAQTKLNSLIEISKEPCSDNIANLLNRIKHLYQISINEQYDICELYEHVISSKAKQYLAYRIVQRYFRDSCFQASLEMLLLDCVAILKNNKDFKWLKDSYLFNGIDVRNVLAHGDPLLDSVGDILDPKDLPSELVKKMLQLFEDQKDIEALRDLWQKAKLKERAVDSGRCVLSRIWQEYSKLLKDPNDSETYNFLVSFLQIVPDPEINLISPFLEKVPDSEKN
ncbi:hypothetical protein AVEN_82807-1 [Araneus ventricosus]|uniref:Uncharacterized protein n=1 Tax=Araneus ventricosus TaxID=182803 RepID=A0A4Y2DBD2_ARAVE|nr:hypothetical protein AVEN_82807-1 [Araneus ventricosus]